MRISGPHSSDFGVTLRHTVQRRRPAIHAGQRRYKVHLPTVIIGIVAIAYGIYTLWARTAKPEQFKKLEAMKKQMGPAAGNIIHLIAYSVVPLVVGAVFLVTGLQGRSIF